MKRRASKQTQPNPFVDTNPRSGRGLLKYLSGPRFPFTLVPNQFSFAMAISLSLVIVASLGLDYIARPESVSPSLSIVEQSMPLDWWGYIFLIFGAAAFLGNLFSVWPIAIVGHGVIAFNYLALGVGVLWSLFEKWEGYGWSTGVTYLCFAAFHYIIADACYDAWAREWKYSPPPPIVIQEKLKDGDNGSADI
jgi:hypothetical protein